MARVRGPAARARRRRAFAAARTGEVPGHLLRGPRRVLPGARGRAQGPGRRGLADPVRRRPAPERGAAGHRRAGDRARRSAVGHLRRLGGAGPGARGGAGGGLVIARRGGPAAPDRGVQSPDLPGAHALVGRPRPPLPLYLQPVAESHRAGGRSHQRGGTRGPGEGPSPPAALRRHARRGAVRGPRADHRRAAGDVVPGHGDRGALRLPGDAQCRPRARRGRGRRPSGRGRDGAAPASVRTGRAPRGGGGDLRRHARHARARARPRRR